MSKPDLYSSAAHIRDAVDDLQIAWQEASEKWSDGVSQRFCKTHLDPLGPIVKLALDSIARMAISVDQMHRDCDE